MICEALAQLIARHGSFTVCGALTEGRKLIASIEQTQPDLVLMDLMLTDCDSMELIKQVRALFASLPVLVLCSHAEATHAQRCLRAGASGYIMKSEGVLDLFDAIASVLGGKMHLSPRMSAVLLHRLLTPARPSSSNEPGASQLTDRELRILEFIGAGLRTREIAERLGRSVKTIEAHRENIKTKLGLRSGAELVTHAAEWVRTHAIKGIGTESEHLQQSA